MDFIYNLSPPIFTLTATLAGFLMIDDMTVGEQNAIAGWFFLLGQVLQTNAGQQALIQGNATGGVVNLNSKEVKSIYNPIVYDPKVLAKIFANIYPNNNNEDINADNQQHQNDSDSYKNKNQESNNFDNDSIDLLKKAVSKLQQQLDIIEEQLKK